MGTRLIRLLCAFLLLFAATAPADTTSQLASTVAKRRAGGASQIVAATDAAVFRSPYTWLGIGGSAIATNNPGAYLKTVFSGTSCVMTVDVSHLVAAGILAANYPAISWQVDGGTVHRVQLTSATGAISFGRDYADTTHTLRVTLVGAYWLDDRWNTPVQSLRVTGFVIGAGKALSAPTLAPKRMLIFGDSHGEGYEALGAGATVALQDASKAYGALLGARFDAEYGIVAFAGQGFNQANGTANVPACIDAWDFYWSGQSRLSGGLLIPAPDYVVTGHTHNDNIGVATTVTAFIDQVKVAAPDAELFLATAPNYNVAAQLSAGVSAAAYAKAHFIDTVDNLIANPLYTDGFVHLNVAGHIEWADRVGDAMEAILP